MKFPSPATLDYSRMALAVAPHMQAIVRAAAQVEAAMSRLGAVMAESKASFERALDRRTAALEARMIVRAGLHPDYATVEGVSVLVRRILNAPGSLLDAGFLDGALNPRQRSLIAAAALRGWVESYPDDEQPILAWHRLIGPTVLEVGRSAA